jgi:predicted AlkP superfamily pyrophosphatase or phosphodiesterase
MRRTVVINVVGMTPDLLAHAPRLRALAERGAMRTLDAVTPAVTCSAQATFLTGRMPDSHGCVANGWYEHGAAEAKFWQQNNALMEGDKVWHAARRRNPAFTCAQLFWWYNMYAEVDWSVTPRPIYMADGRKLPDVYTFPASLHGELNDKLGTFPLFNFWGPMAGIVSSRWITDCALHMHATHKPTLSLVYLPHLDYNLQRLGPDHPQIAQDVAAVDALCGELIDQMDADGGRVMVLSEYGITAVDGDIAINRALRRAGWLAVRDEQGQEKMDPGASDAFALADHQVAHIYVKRPELLARVKALVEGLDGVESVLDAEGMRAAGLAHARSGDLMAISRADKWFSYYYWLDEARAPDFARTVDIHRKPGYDPVELFLDPALGVPKLHVGWKLLKRKLGMRSLLDVIPLDGKLVKGSHGRPTDKPEHGPLVISSHEGLLPASAIKSTDVHDLILDHVFM